MTSDGPGTGAASASPTTAGSGGSPAVGPSGRTWTPTSQAATAAVLGGGYGNIYTPHAGSMIIQVQRESGLQSRTIVLSGRQVRVLRFIMSRTGKLIAAAAAMVAVLLIVEASRVPTLTYRITRMEHTAQRLDTLERSLSELQKRYDQVRTMMGGDAVADGQHGATAAVGFAPAPAIQTRAPVNTAGSTDAPTGGAAAAAAAAAAAPATTGDEQAADSTPIATPTTHHARARRTPAATATPAPQPAVVPPAPDSGTSPSPQAEPQ